MRRFLGAPFLALTLVFFYTWCAISGANGIIGEMKDDEEHS